MPFVPPVEEIKFSDENLHSVKITFITKNEVPI